MTDPRLARAEQIADDPEHPLWSWVTERVLPIAMSSDDLDAVPVVSLGQRPYSTDFYAEDLKKGHGRESN